MLQIFNNPKSQLICLTEAFGSSAVLPPNASNEAKLVTRPSGAILPYQDMQLNNETLRTILSIASGALVSNAWGLDPHVGFSIGLGIYAILTPINDENVVSIAKKIIFPKSTKSS
jgi:hypothetical protein